MTDSNRMGSGRHEEGIGDAESALMACVIQHPDALHQVCEQGMKPTHLVNPVHREIFAAAVNLLSAGRLGELSATALIEHLRRLSASETEARASAAAVARLASMMVMKSRAGLYAQAVFDQHRDRAAFEIAGRLQESVRGRGEDAILEAVNELVALTARGRDSHSTDYLGLLHAGYDYLRSLTDPKSRPGVIYSGIRALDEITGGAHPGDLMVVAGRVSMGKTAYMVTSMDAAVRSEHLRLQWRGAEAEQAPKNNPIAVFSADQSTRQVGLRRLIQLGGIDSHQARMGMPTHADVKRANEAIREARANPLPIYINDAPNLSVEQIVAEATALHYEHGIKAVFVDYLQKIHAGGFRASEKSARVSHVAATLKNLARTLDIPVIAMAQFSREAERTMHGVPSISHLANSAEIEMEATCVVALHRAELYEDSPDRKGVADIIVLKNSNGPVGACECAYDETTMTFTDLTQPRDVRLMAQQQAEDDAQETLIAGAT